MAKLTEAEKRKNFEKTVGSSENDMGPLPELKPKQYSPKDISSKTPASSRNGIGPMGIPAPKKTPEPTFKSDVDNMVSGVKKIDDTLVDSLRKAAGNEEKGILGKYTKLSRGLPEAKKKGGKVKCMVRGGTASSRADGCAVRGKTKA